MGAGTEQAGRRQDHCKFCGEQKLMSRLDLEQAGAAELKFGAWEMDFGGHGTVRLSWEGRRAE